MKNMEYRVTIEKCEKILGEPLLGLLHPWKSWRFRIAFIGSLLAAIMFSIMVLVLKSKAGTLVTIQGDFYFLTVFLYVLIMAFAGVWSFISIPYLFKDMFQKEVAKKMKDLINDPELLWLNFEYGKKNYQNINFEWKKNDKHKISDTNLKAMAFLKNEETSQGMYRTISGFQDSSSSNRHLKRLSEKGVIAVTGNDYQYVPFEFVIIDDLNKVVQNEEAEKLKKILNKAWERMMEKG